MNGDIMLEVKFFFVSVACGVLLLIAYDLLRIVRRILKQNGFLVAIEDLLFWIAGGVFFFHTIYTENYGIIRSFSIAGLILGMVLYHNTISGPFVDLTSGFINRVIRLLKKGILILFRPLGWLLKRIRWLLLFFGLKIKKPFRNLIKGLKSTLKTVKISLTKK